MCAPGGRLADGLHELRCEFQDRQAGGSGERFAEDHVKWIAQGSMPERIENAHMTNGTI